jgi:hypothetical protein
MSWSDPIVDEVRRARDAYAARFNYNLRAIFHDLKEKEKRSGRTVVSSAGTSPPNKALQPAAAALPVPESLTAAEGVPAAEI